jgi:hypothetical protein
VTSASADLDIRFEAQFFLASSAAHRAAPSPLGVLADIDAVLLSNSAAALRQQIVEVVAAEVVVAVTASTW